MNRILKWLALGAVALVSVIVVALVLLVTLVDPNDYRTDISTLARENAGIELDLGGDLSWRFYPVLGFGAENVGLTLKPGDPALVQLGQITVGVRLLPLLSKKIEVDALEIDGLQANLVKDAQGHANWETGASSDAAEPPQSADTTPAASNTGTDTSTASAPLPSINIPGINIRNSRIRYEDKQAGLGYTVEIPELALTDVSLDKPFGVSLNARVRDDAKLDLMLNLETQVRADLNARRFSVTALELAATVAGVLTKPVNANIQGDLSFDQGADSATVNLTRVQLANLVAQTKIEATAVSTAPAFRGNLQSESFDAKMLLEELGMAAPKTQDADAMTRVQLSAGFSGTPNNIALKPLSIKLDQSTLSGEASVIDVAQQAVRFDLKLDTMDVDRYLPAPATAAAEETKEHSENANTIPEGDLIPVEPLRTLNIKGQFSAGEITIKKMPIRDIGLKVKAKDGDIQITDLAAKMFQGTLAGNLGLDARGEQPKITTRVDLQNLEMGDIMQPYVSAQLLTGRTNMNLNTTTQGNDMDTLLRQALGQIDLNLPNTVLHGVNLNQLVVDALKAKIGDLALLMPDYEQRLPGALKGDTQIRDMLANMKVEKGHLITPNFTAQTGEGNLSASGDIDLISKGFDYRFGVTLSSLSDQKYLKGVEWPVRCRGSLETPVTDWCRPDTKAISSVLEKAGKQALRDEGAKKLGEKLGIEGADEARVQEELRQKAKAEEDRAREKANQKVNKQLDKLFKKF